MMDIDELERLAEENVTVLELMVIKVMIEGVKYGDQSRLNFVLDRTIGKVDSNVNIKLPAPTVVERFEGDEQVVLGRAGQRIEVAQSSTQGEDDVVVDGGLDDDVVVDGGLDEESE